MNAILLVTLVVSSKNVNIHKPYTIQGKYRTKNNIHFHIRENDKHEKIML